MISGIHHVQITIPELTEAEARKFYIETLMLDEVPKPPTLRERGGFWVQCGDRQIHVGLEDGVNRRVTRAHIAYQVTDVAFWKARLVEAGCELVKSIPIEGYERFETRDPFGNRIEFIQPVG